MLYLHTTRSFRHHLFGLLFTMGTSMRNGVCFRGDGRDYSDHDDGRFSATEESGVHNNFSLFGWHGPDQAERCSHHRRNNETYTRELRLITRGYIIERSV
jgi:hypothetical protein